MKQSAKVILWTSVFVGIGAAVATSVWLFRVRGDAPLGAVIFLGSLVGFACAYLSLVVMATILRYSRLTLLFMGYPINSGDTDNPNRTGWKDWEEYFHLLLRAPTCEHCGAEEDVSECSPYLKETGETAERRFSECASKRVERLGWKIINRLPYCPLCVAVVRPLSNSD